MKTEVEARKCWCPFFKLPAAVSPYAEPCRASECMAWRWLDGETKFETTCVYDVDGKEGLPPDGDGWKRGHRTKAALSTPGVMFTRTLELRVARRGFCGLAGRP